MKPKVFKGDTFRNLLMQYSYSRMSVDPEYRREVRKALAQKKAERRAVEAQKEQVGA
jgi:Spy/CpxP family protein refolding chaperone